jgi:hypothetical protein
MAKLRSAVAEKFSITGGGRCIGFLSHLDRTVNERRLVVRRVVAVSLSHPADNIWLADNWERPDSCYAKVVKRCQRRAAERPDGFYGMA